MKPGAVIRTSNRVPFFRNLFRMNERAATIAGSLFETLRSSRLGAVRGVTSPSGLARVSPTVFLIVCAFGSLPQLFLTHLKAILAPFGAVALTSAVAPPERPFQDSTASPVSRAGGRNSSVPCRRPPAPPAPPIWIAYQPGAPEGGS